MNNTNVWREYNKLVQTVQACQSKSRIFKRSLNNVVVIKDPTTNEAIHMLNKHKINSFNLN
jgi:hypothetical protein